VKRSTFILVAGVIAGGLTLSGCSSSSDEATNDTAASAATQSDDQVFAEAEDASATESAIPSTPAYTPPAPSPTRSAQAAPSVNSTAAFIRQARGSAGSGWPFQSDGNLVSLGQDICGLFQQGASPDMVVGALLSSGSGATRQEVSALVSAANAQLC
jgi:outer membrane murein-binding lipoprotein Lpp